MKLLFAVMHFAIMVSLCNSCKKDTDKIEGGFDYEKAAGLWVPYEVTDEFGTVHPGPFTANNLFGSYAESVQLKSDRTFIPVTWFDQDNIVFKAQEAGIYQWFPGNILRFRRIHSNRLGAN